MEPREFALTHLRAIRKAAVDLLETIAKWRLLDGDLDPRLDAAHFCHSAVGGRVIVLGEALGEWGQLPPKEPTPFLFTNEAEMFQGTEAIDAGGAWSVIFQAYWDLVCAKFSGGHTHGDVVPVKVGSSVVRRLEHGITLLDRFEEHQAGKPAVEDQGGGKYPWGNDDPDSPLSPTKLADRLGIPTDDKATRERLRSRLVSWRKANFDGGWKEIRDPKPREARYAYPVGVVWSLIEDLRHSG
jgi:hypothetical protein